MAWTEEGNVNIHQLLEVDMKLSAPIYILKNRAKALKRLNSISFAEALDRIAREEGYSTWSLLMTKEENRLPNRYDEILDYLNPGDTVLVAARPHIGKLLFVLGLLEAAGLQYGRNNYIFSLIESEEEIKSRLVVDLADKNYSCSIDCSDDICADYIVDVTGSDIKEGDMILIDYLQMLDEKRVNPPLQLQVERLKSHAREKGCIIFFICQIDRRVQNRADQRPTIDDIRLPNQLDLRLFNKKILLFRERPDAIDAEICICARENHRINTGFDPVEMRFFDLSL